MSASFSTCLDCGTPIIGARERCPACHDQHSRKQSLGHVAISWVVFAEFIVILVLVGVLATRGCL